MRESVGVTVSATRGSTCPNVTPIVLNKSYDVPATETDSIHRMILMMMTLVA
jgi:hypothetical protein